MIILMKPGPTLTAGVVVETAAIIKKVNNIYVQLKTIITNKVNNIYCQLMIIITNKVNNILVN